MSQMTIRTILALRSYCSCIANLSCSWPYFFTLSYASDNVVHFVSSSYEQLSCLYFRVSRKNNTSHLRRRHLPIAMLFFEIWTSLPRVANVVSGVWTMSPAPCVKEAWEMLVVTAILPQVVTFFLCSAVRGRTFLLLSYA